MVREIERLRPELHPRAGDATDGLEERDIPALRVRPANRVAPRVAELARRRQREGGRVEPEDLIDGRALREPRAGDVGSPTRSYGCAVVSPTPARSLPLHTDKGWPD